MIKNYLSWSLLPMFLTLLAVTNLCFCQDAGSGGCAESGEALPLDSEECASVCSSGHTWCDEGLQCDVNVESGAGFDCISCPPGYYGNSIGSCEIGKYFGGKIFLSESVIETTAQTPDETAQTPVETTTQPQTSGGTTEATNGTSFGGKVLAVESRTSCAEDPRELAESILVEIYNTSEYYVNSSILDWNDTECSGLYELVFANNVNVDANYVYEILITATENCTETNDVANKFNCEQSRGYGIDPGAACTTNGAFYGKCDPATTNSVCNVSDSGSLDCYCKSEKYVYLYPGAYNCTEIKCSKDQDCSGGGIHGICNIDAINGVNNYCQCKWGFTGDTCGDPWWFVFTVLTGAFGALVIVVLVACICMSTRTRTVKDDLQKDDLDLKNPFVDFQPGVRARVSTNIYSSVTDSISTPTTYGHSNPAFNNNAYDENDKGTAYAAAAQGNDYF